MKRVHYAILIFLATLVIYILTLSPSLGPGDSPAWIVNSLAMGLPPAPGNILYLLAAALFSKLFMAVVVPLMAVVVNLMSSVFSVQIMAAVEQATGVNLFSALSASTAAALLFALLDRVASRLAEVRDPSREYLRGNRVVLAAGTLFLAALPSFWSQAVTSGPWAFNILLVVLLAWMLVRVEEGSLSPDVGMMLWAYLAGLSFSNQYVFLLSVAVLIIFLVQGKRVGSALRENIGSVLFLFGLGLTIYLYLWVRPVEDPALGGPVTLFSGEFWKYVFSADGLAGSFERNAGLFTHQFPLFFSYMKQQAGHWIAGTAVLAVFAYGLFRMLRNREQRRIAVAGLALLVLSALAVVWLYNPRLGIEQAWDAFPRAMNHESEPIGHVFVFTYLVMGIFTVFGAMFLKADLSRFFHELTDRLELPSRRLERSARFLIALVLLGGLVAFFPYHWKDVDLSGYYVNTDLGMNMLVGTEPDAILVSAGEQDFYPLFYADSYMMKDSGRSIVSYLHLNEPDYIKRLKDTEPPVPMTYDNTRIERISPVRLDRSESFRSGEMQVSYPPGTVFLVRDVAMMDIVRANGFQRPLYFSQFLGGDNMLGLHQYLASQGLMVKLLEKDPFTEADSSDYWRPAQDMPAINVRVSSQLVWGLYGFRTTLSHLENPERHKVRSLVPYARLHIQLAEAMIDRDNVEAAATNFRQCEFYDPNYENMLLSFASRMARAGHYEQSKQFATDYFEQFPPDPLKWAGLAKIALENQDSVPATEMLLESIKVDPDFLLGFRKLLRLYDSMGQKTMVSAFLSRWLARHPQDEATRRLWEEYNATKTLPPGFQD